MCDWVFLGVVSSQAGAFESQQQLYGVGLHWEHCTQCESQADIHYHVGKGEHTDTALISAFDIMTRIKNPQCHTEQSHTLNASVGPHSLLHFA